MSEEITALSIETAVPECDANHRSWFISVICALTLPLYALFVQGFVCHFHDGRSRSTPMPMEEDETGESDNSQPATRS